MGEMSEYLLNGDDDYITGEYIGPGPGYPRTMARYKSSGKGNDERWIERISQRIVADPRLSGACNKLIQDGYQIKYQGNKFTFFPKHCKMTWKGKWYVHNSGQEVEKILELTGFYKKEIRDAEQPIAPVNNTKLCIDHIKRKIETIEKVKPGNGVLMILKELCKELEQFL